MFRKKVYFPITFKSFLQQYWLNWNLSVDSTPLAYFNICHLFGYPQVFRYQYRDEYNGETQTRLYCGNTSIRQRKCRRLTPIVLGIVRNVQLTTGAHRT